MNIIQIGCNDCQDDCRTLITKSPDVVSNFVVVDASYACVQIAKEKYSFLGDRLTPVVTAIGLINGVVDFYTPQGDEKSAHSSLSPEHVLMHEHPVLTRQSLPCLNINSFLESLRMETIDCLFIDVEGYDVTVLLEMDFTRFKPKFLQYEFFHSDGTYRSGQKHELLLQKLAENGYTQYKKDQYNISFYLKAS